MTRRMLIALAAGGSAALLAGAFAFQHLGGLAPCELCLWQRWPHAAAIAIGAAALALGMGALAWAGAAAALATAGIGAYHTGVERKWWDGPAACSGGDMGTLTTDQLFDRIMAAPLVRCDEVPWDMLGLSMASWNALIALALAALWIAAARARA